MAESLSIAIAALSIAANMFILMILFGTGIGKTVLRKFFKKFSWRKPGFMPVLILGSNNVLYDKTVKHDEDGKFVYNKNTYVINPRVKIDHEGIPHSFYVEGVAEPVDLHNDPINEKMSCKMMERIIFNATSDDVFGTLKTVAVVAGVLMLIGIGAMVISLYFNWQIFDVMVQEGTGQLIRPN